MARLLVFPTRLLSNMLTPMLPFRVLAHTGPRERFCRPFISSYRNIYNLTTVFLSYLGLITHFSPSFLDPRGSLDNAVAFRISNAYASSTLANRKSKALKYLQFCRLLQTSPLPISVTNLCRYCVFLGRTIKYSSIVNYLDGIRWRHVMHVRLPTPSPLPLSRATDAARPETSSLHVG